MFQQPGRTKCSPDETERKGKRNRRNKETRFRLTQQQRSPPTRRSTSLPVYFLLNKLPTLPTQASSRAARQRVSQPISQPISQSISQPASQSVSLRRHAEATVALSIDCQTTASKCTLPLFFYRAFPLSIVHIEIYHIREFSSLNCIRREKLVILCWRFRVVIVAVFFKRI